MALHLQESAPEQTPGATVAIAAHDVHKSYRVGDRDLGILHGISLSVNQGELVAIMGPSGSGKSTLLYCLAGLEAPTEGSVTIAGQPLAGRSRAELARMRRSTVGFVFQSYNLIPTLTVEQNVTLPWLLGRRKVPEGLVARTLAAVGLEHRRDARPPSMSGGEQQRVALARVLAQQPEVIFADEPTGALDTRTGELVMAELSAIAHSPGRSVLVVTHDPRVAARCDRILFLRDGVLVDEAQGLSAGEVAAVLTDLGSDDHVGAQAS